MANETLENGSQLKHLLPSKFSGPQNGFSGWKPFYLRRWVLGLFLLAFCGIIAALEALNEVSKKDDGLAPSVPSMRYAWTYGPTAILTLVAVLWARVEYQTKRIVPWQRLREGPATAEQSVLVDYISEMQPVSLFRAIKRKDYLPAAAVTCSMLLRLLIVFSTGLFTLTEVPVVFQDVPIQLLDSLNTNRFQYDNKSYDAYDAVNAFLFQNLTWPDGTNKNLAFQRISTSGLPSDAIVNVTVDGLTADLKCESASIEVKKWELVKSHNPVTIWEESVNRDISISTPSCNISKVYLGDELYGEFQFEYQHVKCDRSSGLDGDRVLVTGVEYRTGDESSRYDISSDKKSWKNKKKLSIERSVQLVCKPTLSRVKLQVAVNVSEPLSNARIRKMGPSVPLSTSMNWKVANTSFDIDHTADQSRPVHFMRPFGRVDATFGAALTLGAYLAEPPTTGTVNNLFDADFLSDTVGAYYRTITAQVMHNSMAEPKRTSAVGSKTINARRVLISSLSLRAIEACLALAALLAVSMIVLLSRKAMAGIALAPWDPNKISAIAAMLPTSDGFCSLLRKAGALPSDAFDGYLKGHCYQTGYTQKGFSIAVTESDCDLTPDVSPQNPKTENPSWKPLPNRWMRFTILFIVALVIAALEVVLYLSRSQEGLATVSLDDYLHYLWTMIPSLVMVGIGLFFGSLDFNTRCLAPYARLKQPKGASFDDSMSLTFLDSLGITIFFRALRARSPAVLATTITTMVSAFLATATSGLYYPIDVPMQKTANFTQTSVFWDSSLPVPEIGSSSAWEQENYGVVTANYILRDNVSFPRWTYDTLAFPTLSIDKNRTRDDFVDIKVPALRSALTCHLQSGAALKPNYTKESNSYHFTIDLLRNSACARNKTVTTTVLVDDQNTMKIKPHAYFGTVMQNTCGVQEYITPHSTSYIWGYLNGPDDKTPIRHVAALTCVDKGEYVETTARFKLPSMDLVESHPPVPDESTAKINSKVHIPYIDVRGYSPIINEGPLDSLFQTLVSGRLAIPVQDLGNVKENAKIVKAIKHQHQLVRAQQFSSSIRLDANATDHKPILGNVTVTSRLRLVQDPASTRVLEALLGVMLLFGLIGSLLLNTDGVLPKNPCSIAAVASLLADSNFLDQFDSDTVKPDGKSREKGLFSRCRFFLGYLQRETAEGESVEKFTIYMDDPVEGSDERLIATRT